jgi:DNA polymerase-3 subunit delta'
VYGFQHFVGSPQLVSRLAGAVARGRVSHAYLFVGPQGVGKKFLANSFAKALLCPTPTPGGNACGTCPACNLYERENHPDIVRVTPVGKKTIGVDEIRALTLSARVLPHQSPRKIFIIDQAHTQTAAAQNALLKTIEEPDSHGVFLLLAETMGLLPTVLSRCVLLKLRPLPDALVANSLPDTPAAAEIAACAQGSIGRARALAGDENFIALRRDVFEILDKLTGIDTASLLALAKGFEPYKDRAQEVLDLLLAQTRARLVQHPSRPALAALEAVWAAKGRLSHYSNFQLTMEVLLMDLHKAQSPTGRESQP